MSTNQSRLLESNSQTGESDTISNNLSMTSSQSPMVVEEGAEDNYLNADQLESGSVRSDKDGANFKVSKQRWAFLFAISVFGLTNSLVDSESAILHTMLDLLEIPLDRYIYINILLSYLPLLTIIPTAWFIDKFGLRLSLYVAIVIMLIRNSSKALLFNPDLLDWQRFKFAYWIISGIGRMQVLVIFFCTPLKISESWFATRERSIAWTVIISSVSVGDAIASFSYPRFIHKLEDVKPLFYISIACAIVTILAVLTCITRSKPKHPVSERSLKSSENKQVPIYITIKRIIYHRDLMIHALHEAFFEGALIATASVQQDIMLASGHTKIFVGDQMTISSIAGIILLIGLSPLVNSIKNIVLACKLGSFIRSILFIIYLACLLYPVDNRIIIMITIFYIICRSWAAPNFNNMTAHLISGSVSETTISSFQFALTILTVTINQAILMSLIKYNKGKPDYTNPIIFASACGLVCSLVYVIFFKGEQASTTIQTTQQEHLVSPIANSPNSA